MTRARPTPPPTSPGPRLHHRGPDHLLTWGDRAAPWRVHLVRRPDTDAATFTVWSVDPLDPTGAELTAIRAACEAALAYEALRA